MTSLVALTLSAFAWSAPESCPSQAELQARVGEVRSQIDAEVKSVDGKFALTVRIDDQVRSFVTTTCAEAADTTVFLVDLGAQRPRPRNPLKIVAEPVRVDELVAAPAPSKVHLHLGFVGGVEWVLLPEPVTRLGLFAQVDVGLVTLMLEVRGAPLIRMAVAGGPQTNASVNVAPLFDAQAGVCRLFHLGPVQAGPCAQAGLGVVWAVGLGVQTPQPKSFAVWTAGGGLRAAFPFTDHVELQAFASLRFGPQPQYQFEFHGPLIRTALVGVDTGLAVGAHW